MSFGQSCDMAGVGGGRKQESLLNPLTTSTILCGDYHIEIVPYKIKTFVYVEEESLIVIFEECVILNIQQGPSYNRGIIYLKPFFFSVKSFFLIRSIEIHSTLSR